MTVSTSNYEELHGRKPKPSQHGHWTFMIERRPGEYTDFQTTGTYRDALRDAKAEAKQIGGASRITVQA